MECVLSLKGGLDRAGTRHLLTLILSILDIIDVHNEPCNFSHFLAVIEARQAHVRPLLQTITVLPPHGQRATHMCNYILLLPLCQHFPSQVWAAPGDESCPALRAQLMRIYDPAEWASPETIPFNLPERCMPCPENISIVRTRGYCSWECWWRLEGWQGVERPHL
ncbi:hypothetical protein CONLIGDRAFT_677391 [Coniochaeta ligniaria NRRL 30616]|uniref:Uncharacterized protein n=1 Tax=Coniochaeta ligniaria NRRL 30616 TaxID=1408157 RepID=A0A1J7JUB4_9PEZI|nr:hypothetical protein CONLIGDRAFT_677391 [Coniochaeta ligniaria NRRL 30616]